MDTPSEVNAQITSLNAAANSKDTEKVISLLRSGEDPFYEAPEQLSAICEFTLLERLDLIQEVFKLYPERNKYDKALILACVNGHTEILDFLLKKGCNPNVILLDKHTLIMLENFLSSKDQRTLFLVNTIKLKKENLLGLNALFWASAFSKDRCVDLLLKYGANPQGFKAEELITSPLIISTIVGNPQSVKALLLNGAKKDFKDQWGKTALEHLEDIGRFADHRKILRLLKNSN
jgi:ankyrin repeat protein